MDKLYLDVEFVRQFEDLNFRLLGRLILPDNSFWFNKKWPVENSVSV